MIRINLLPYRAKLRQRQILFHVACFLVVIGAMVLLSLAANVFFSLQLSNRIEQQVAMDAELKVLNAKIGELAKLESAREEVQSKLKIVDELKVDQFRSLNLLVELAHITPKNVWVTSLADGQTEISIKARAGTSESISAFMRALNSSIYFQEDTIHLGAVTRKIQDGIPVRAFDLKASFAKLKDKKEGKK
ncbi:MAG: PilN domain-containing protein [Mariprofundaceae bacterium]|nr:PilN domain-containing protein [Mariprofundaceae bacterium]